MRRNILAKILIGAALLPLILFATGLSYWSYTQKRAALRAETEARARSVALSLQRHFENLESVLKALGQSQAFDQAASITRGSEFGERLVAAIGIAKLISVALPSGERILDIPAVGGSSTAIEIDSLTRAVKSKIPQVGSLRQGPRGLVAFAVRAPVLRDGVVKYVLSAVIEARVVADWISDEDIPEPWRATVADREGNVATRLRSQGAHVLSLEGRTARQQAPSGFYEAEPAAGFPIATGYSVVPSTGWSVHVSVPQDVYNAPLRDAFLALLAGITSAILLAAMCAVAAVQQLRTQREQERLLAESRRMEALGRITGGVAHDFNNILMVVQGSATAIERRANGSEFARYISALHSVVERGRGLTGQLLTFAKRSDFAPQPLSVSALLQELRSLLDQLAGSSIRVVIDVPEEGLWPVYADQSGLEIALINLVANARDAVNGVGTITLSARNVQHKAGPFVQIDVRDTGAGIASDVLPKIFEPFFTTKEAGKGTGLGLSQVFGFVQQSGGDIEVASKQDAGTTVRLFLPRSSALPSRRDTHADMGEIAGKRVLVVDDNEEVAVATQQMLEAHGVDVVTALHPEEALQRLKTDRFDLVISDVVMPEKSGFELAQEIRRDGEMPILLVSGYHDRLLRPPGLDAELLMKPYTHRDLVNAIARLIRPTDRADHRAQTGAAAD